MVDNASEHSNNSASLHVTMASDASSFNAMQMGRKELHLEKEEEEQGGD